MNIYDFVLSRKKNIVRYKQLCREAKNIESQETLLKMATTILKHDIADRFEEELQLIVRATEKLQFFIEINQHQKNVEKRLHLQVCQKMQFQQYKKGEIVFKQGEKADRAYIILDGTANLYCSHEPEYIRLQCEQSLKSFQSSKQRKLHPIAIVNHSRREKIKQRLALPIHMLGKLKTQSHLNLSQQYAKQLYQTYEIIQEIKKDEDQEEDFTEQIHNIGLALTNGIPLANLHDLDYCFKDGVFKHKFIQQINVGQMFGEVALMFNQPRTGTIIAKTHLDLGIISKEDYNSLLKDLEISKIDKRVHFFQINFFRDQPRFVILKYCYNFKKIKLNRGSTIFNQGDKINHIYLIKKGEVELCTKQDISLQCSNEMTQLARSREQLMKLSSLELQKVSYERVLCTVGAGQVFGEVEYLLKKHERDSSAIVRSDYLVVYVLNISHLMKILNDQYTLKKQLIELAQMKQTFFEQQKAQIFEFQEKQYAKQIVNQQMQLLKPTESQSDRQSTPIKTEPKARNINKILKMRRSECRLFRKDISQMSLSQSQRQRNNRQPQNMVTEEIKKQLQKSSSAQSKLRLELGSDASQKDVQNYILFKNECGQRYLKTSKSTENTLREANSPTGAEVMEYKSFCKFEPNSNSVQYQNGSTQKSGTPTSVNFHIIEKLTKQSRLIKSKHNLFRQKPQSRVLLSRYQDSPIC